MSNWTLHWLDATGDLSAWKDRITGQINDAYGLMSPFVRPSQMDVLIERGNETVTPETGMSAHVTRPNLSTLIFDPYNENFADTLTNGLVQRQMVKTAHLAMRAAGPGYGFTLGGAMVSEGLAAQFVRLVFDSPREPWDCAFDDDELVKLWPDQRTMMSTKFDHSEWFSGAGAYPRWLGYTMGARIVENWLLSGADLTPERLINVPAPKVLNAVAAQALVS
ncbi:DUF2268 domain-containing putative Zn-dependent protease [Neptunicoccus cionae]|uniref:DUF2268 domain-containing protein n=1 Tax=Neptunicoccus cionae TaxID=2035344 RepID=A0A916R2N5_9RHOB|nr:DUF2268 domain-containing putative Zn-dependent protease [Amylibacter cionae]GGA30450.1 hypothetical protein GCM10011498_34530 [Amylibacter cionae]